MVDSFDNSVRDTLCEIIGSESSGLTVDTDWVDDPIRCRNRLRDSHPEAGVEIRLLYLAHWMGLPNELRPKKKTSDSDDRQVPLFEAKKIASIFRRRNGLTERAARWAVGSWADALGVEIQERRRKFDSPAITSFSAETHPESQDDSQVLIRWNVWGMYDRITLTPPGVEVDSKGEKSLQVNRQTPFLLRVNHDGETLHASATAGPEPLEWKKLFSEYKRYYASVLLDFLERPVSFEALRRFLRSKISNLEERIDWLKKYTLRKLKYNCVLDKYNEINLDTTTYLRVVAIFSVYVYTVFVDENTYPEMVDIKDGEYTFIKIYISFLYASLGLFFNYAVIKSYWRKDKKTDILYFLYLAINILFCSVLVTEW